VCVACECECAGEEVDEEKKARVCESKRECEGARMECVWERDRESE